MIRNADDAEEFAAWEARQKASRPAGGVYRAAWRVQSFIVGFWLLVFVLLLVVGQPEAAVPFIGVAFVHGLVLLIIRRYRPTG